MKKIKITVLGYTENLYYEFDSSHRINTGSSLIHISDEEGNTVLIVPTSLSVIEYVII